ncbi:hypothetical protein AAFC00_000752 [Neodothiora populina]|uniref:Carboxylic ester hydrolase n=1 Tax=Neodothiora populina TaxID=2781224 RepID=A0ABR3PE38_9PEZI
MAFTRYIVAFGGLILGRALAAPVTNACSATVIGTPQVDGTKVLDVTAETVTGYSLATYVDGSVKDGNVDDLAFCNVTITYEHPDKNDKICVSVWLPTPDKWNGRFQGTGGGGWVMGLGPEVLAPAVDAGYAAANTDGGHNMDEFVTSWARDSAGDLDMYALEVFASIGLDDMAKFGKQVTASYYGEPAKYSYWAGCSTGGRQGLMNAQRYPTNYDGILAMAPAINWQKFIPSESWPQIVMNEVGYWPPTCEFAAINDFLMDACDELDGVKDGIIGNPYQCDYDVSTAVGEHFMCNGSDWTIDNRTVEIVKMVWDGPRDQATGESLWYGLSMGASLNMLATTVCSINNTDCAGSSFATSQAWIQYYLEENSDFDVNNMGYAGFASAFASSVSNYTDIIGTDNPDLSDFKANGGKMISWHGLADQLIFTNGTFDYYNKVSAQDSGVDDFYRLFTSPGVEHCGDGIGAMPDDILADLVNWVENGIAPETLAGTFQEGSATRPLCQYPKMQVYLGGDADLASSFGCE